ncbi:AfsR/SARP family transcriptional regulator [Dactylosporangium matsuzakiense]|uniref:SARP family transcriptional regulator n=1 Tax=Dactylosporangium matsuzakiense TaxID=53360 RepID=A0A9W6KL39_9ACTN|nr:AfsR/SARP family transcriptional regulator [Dactylosporangium matsuzakiense]GLL02271.1 SARP family transcriptional regulator [Dactylosporangium matsuzakiense]
MQVRLLGPLDVVLDGVAQPVPGRRRRALLAVLAVHCGQSVDTSRIGELAWGPDAPSRNTLQANVSYLRHTFRLPIVSSAPGYRLDLGADGTDILQAEDLIRQGGQAAEPTERVAILQAALALWRGLPLADVADVAWAQEQVHRLDVLWLQAKQFLLDAQLGLGEHARLVPDLQQLVQQHPHHEHFHGQLMLALYRSGRPADALAVYDRLQRTLADDVGIDPGPALRELHATILRHDPALHLPAPPVAVRPAAAAPAQLPLTLASFTGRSRELANLDALLSTGGAAPARLGPVLISAVSGTAGIGKTTLAVHWAHRVRHHFPDGQLYVNLRGFDPGHAAMDPADALRGFLDALAVPAARIPTGLDAQIDLYRSRLAGKRMLVVLDNANHADQVRPLLPGEPGCLAVITSRNQLNGLADTGGFHPLHLDLLTHAEARDLLTQRLGAERTAAEPDAVDTIIARCARLPLALAIVAARAAVKPGFPLATLAAELGDTQGTLDTLHGGEPATDIRSVFSWSYRTLSAGAARLFRLLGLHRGPDIALPAAASLVGLPAHRTQRLLTELTAAHLLIEQESGRYSLHDLLRAYAVELTLVHDDAADRSAALRRLLEHYLHTSYRAERLLRPNREPIELAPPVAGITLVELADRAQAVAWFTAEQQVLVAAVGHDPGDTGWRPWQLAWSLFTFLSQRSSYRLNVQVQQAGLDAARRAADDAGQGYAHRFLGSLYGRLRDFERAAGHNQQALHYFEQVNDHVVAANIHLTMAWALDEQHRYHEAIPHNERALQAHLAAGNQFGEAVALNNLCMLSVRLGDYPAAEAYGARSLARFTELDDRLGLASTLDTFSLMHFRLGNVEKAADYAHRAITICREIGDRHNEAAILTTLGDGHASTGDLARARDTWREALTILDDLKHADADKLRAKIEAGRVP